jgi:ferric-dicitrate binding protein FerR (iron transport regulator)
LKSNRSLSDIAAQALSADARATPRASSEARRLAIEEIARAMRIRKRRRLIRWTGLGAVAVAASIALAIGFGRNHASTNEQSTASVRAIPAAAASFVRGSPLVVHNGALRSLSDGTPLEPGDRLLVDKGSRTTVALANGTYLVVEDRAELLLAMAAPATTFELASGTVRADVAKLRPHERFIIRTSDAEIEVHGTSFDVSRTEPDPNCGNGTTTRVRVREGIVAVRAGGTESFVRANEVWPTGCARAELAAAAPTASNVGPRLPLASSPQTVRTGSPARSPNLGPSIGPNSKADVGPTAQQPGKQASESAASELAVQNDLFEKAVAKKRAGDASGAIAGFEQLLAQYPASHLAQSARAERMKLLRGIDKERARAAARDYLDRHPSGFARHDAELILSRD